MTKRKTRPIRSNNLQTAAIFIMLVGGLIAISLLFKLATLIKQSKFDGSHRFTVVLSFSKTPSLYTIVSLAPDTHSLSVLNVSSKNSLDKIGTALEIPIDGTVVVPATMNEHDFVISDSNQVSNATQTLMGNMMTLKTDLTALDFIRLWWFVKSLPSGGITISSLSLPAEASEVDKISSSLFSDFTLASEKMSIEIINATDVSGLGNRLARLVSNIGGNVVSVSTSSQKNDASEILYSEEPGYSGSRLQKILHFKKTKREKGGVSDMTIIIGTDALSSGIF